MMECAICRGRIVDRTRIGECGHDTFCYRCIVQWANNSNTCPICQQRFVQLYRDGSVREVDYVDKREDNAMRVLEQFDSEEASIDDESTLGSEGDRYEEDFVVPDGVIITEDNRVIDQRPTMRRRNPYGTAPRNQPDSIITLNGRRITVSWDPPPDDEDASYEPSTDETTTEEEEEETTEEEETEDEDALIL